MLPNENIIKDPITRALALGRTLSTEGIVVPDDLTAFGKSGKRYPSFTP